MFLRVPVAEDASISFMQVLAKLVPSFILPTPAFTPHLALMRYQAIPSLSIDHFCHLRFIRLMKLTPEEREEVIKDVLLKMPDEHIELWKERLKKHYRSFDAYCESCGKIWELTCRRSTLKIIMEKQKLTGPPTRLSPQGSIVCMCKECIQREGLD